MEKRQLNFHQPLLSVRRGSSVTSSPEVNQKKIHNSHSTLPPLPYYKSELKSGPVRNPGVVPFKWEQMPGRPKYENKAPKGTIERQPLAPKLPPGRIAHHDEKPTKKALQGSPCSSSESQADKSPSTLDISSVDRVLSECEGSERETEEKDVSSEDENVTYVDARDTLSRTESFINCSVSGVNGLDDPNGALSGGFSDPQARDFMMGRFLPAAKAVASETPPYASRKHSVARKQPEPVKKVIKWKKQSPQHNVTSNASPHYIYGEGRDEEEDEDDEYEGAEDMSAKLCGLLPRFCLLNPIPGMRDHTQAMSPVRSVRTRPAHAGTFRKSETKDGTNNHRGANFCRKSVAPLKDGSPKSEKRFLDLSEEHRDLSANKLDFKNNGGTELKTLLAQRDTSPAKPAIEKTLYVDSEQVEQSRNSNSSSSESRGRNPSVDYSVQDIKSLCGAEERALSLLKGSDVTDSVVVSTSDDSCQDVGEDLMKYLPKDQSFSLVVDVVQLPKSTVKKAIQKSGPPVTLGPLLPKSPSESWLSRTLPTMSSKSPSSMSYLGNLAFRSSPVDPKRDRMVKTSNVQHMLFQPAGELTPILEN